MGFEELLVAIIGLMITWVTQLLKKFPAFDYPVVKLIIVLVLAMAASPGIAWLSGIDMDQIGFIQYLRLGGLTALIAFIGNGVRKQFKKKKD